MGQRGPPPTPTAILKIRGSRIRNRTDEPEPSREPPVCPEDLNEQANAVWPQVIEQLTEVGTIASTDGHAIERYCRLFVEWRKLQAFIDKHGHSYTLLMTDNDGQNILDAKGNVIIRCRVQNPEVGARNKLTVDLLRLEQNFGLTPAGRASLNVNAPYASAAIPTVRDRTRINKPA